MIVQIVKKVDMESSRGRKKRNPLNDLKREVAIMRTLRHKNIVALQVALMPEFLSFRHAFQHTLRYQGIGLPHQCTVQHLPSHTVVQK